MMKKLLCILLALTLLCGQVLAGEVYIPADVAGTEYENAYEVLTGLSIFTYNDDGSFRPFTPITRGDFAIALGNIMDVVVLEGTVSFSDVPEDHAAFSAVEKLAQLGIIHGDGNAVFSPEESLQVTDALKMLVTAMGYATMAEDLGGYPGGYLSAASEIGLTRGFKSEDGGFLMRGEAAKLLLTALDLPVAVRSGVTVHGGAAFSTDEDRDLLYEGMGIKKIRDRVNANEIFAVDGGSAAAKGKLRIGDLSYEYSNANQMNLVGYSVFCYFREDDDSGEKEIVYLQKDGSENDEMTFAAENAVSYSHPKFYYQDNETAKVKNITISDDLLMIYNGMPMETIAEDDFKPANGEIRFLDNDDDDVYDIVWVETYTNALVSSVTADAVYMKYPSQTKIDLANVTYESFTVTDGSGAFLSVSELKANDVISIYESLDRSVVKLVRSTEQVTGTVSEIFEEDGRISAVIGDTIYNVALDYTASFPSAVEVGISGTFCLDANGDLYTLLDGKSGTELYGYVIKAREKTEMLEDTVEVRMVEESGKVVDRSFAEKVTIDGKSNIKSADVLPLISSALLKPVVYQLNGDGEIKMMDTLAVVEDNDDDRLEAMVATDFDGRYKTGTMVFEGRVAIDTNTRIFMIPGDPENAKENSFGCTTYRYLLNDTQYYDMTSYRIDPDKITADILVFNNGGIRSKGGLCIVTGISTVLNDDGDAVTSYRVLEGTSEVSYRVAEEAVTEEVHKITVYNSSADTTTLIDPEKNLRVEIGDMVKFVLDGAGEIEKICLVYEADPGIIHSVNPYLGDFHQNVQRYSCGNITKVQTDLVELPVLNAGGAVLRYEYYNMKGRPVYIYNASLREENRIRTGAVGDLRDGDNVVIVTHGGTPSYAIKYE